VVRTKQPATDRERTLIEWARRDGIALRLNHPGQVDENARRIPMVDPERTFNN
jgi:hypothetical protein